MNNRDGKALSFNKKNKKCPVCKKPMGWVEGLLRDGSREPTTGRYGCVPCGVIDKMQDSRATRRGKRMAEDLVGVPCMDKRITSQSVGVQIGILRAQQHCATCGNNMGDPCTCKGKCNCVYCRERKL